MLIYTQIYAYIGVYWLAFGPILHYCSPQRRELPTTPRELCKTAKCKHKIGPTLQYLVLALHLRVQDSRGYRRECKEGVKKENYDLNMIEKFSLFFSSFLYLF